MTKTDPSRRPVDCAAPRRPLAGPWVGVPVAVWAAVILLTVLAWLALALAARQGVAEQAAARNQRAADRLATRLGSDLPSRADAQARLEEFAALAQVDQIRWADASGVAIAQLGGSEVPVAPGWFVRLAPIAVPDGLATLMVEGRPTELRVRMALAPVWDALWRNALQLGLALAVLGTLIVSAAALARAALRRTLARLTSQLGAVRSGEVPDPIALSDDHLLHPIAQAVAKVADQRFALMAAHAEQIEALRRQAYVDALTELPNRRAFVAELDEQLDPDAGFGGIGLVLLRVRDLYGLNLRQGHARTDELLLALADRLRVYPRQVPGCMAGRLNGSDFALLLPVAGQALGSAQSLLAALRPLLAPLDSGAGVAVGAVELQRLTSASDALALADEALVRAEIGGRFALEAVGQPARSPLGGQSDWTARIRAALDEGRVRLEEHPMRSADGRLISFDCPLHLQLDPHGPFEPASRWFALAARTPLVAEVDERAIELALRSITDDGVGRCVNVAAASLATPGFIDRVARRLAAASDRSFRLWIDIAEATARDHPDLVRDACLRWRPTGAMVALEHAGDALARHPQLVDLGLDCVRIDGRYVDGIAAGPGSEQLRRYLRALVHLIQGVGLQVTAEGVRNADDLDVLWSFGFDAATGPAVHGGSAEVDLPLELEAPAPAEAEQAEDCLVAG